MQMKPENRIHKEVEGAYSLYGAKLYNFAYYSTYSAEDAQDLAQEAFLRYAQALEKDTRIENPQAYLYRIVRNLSINLAKKRARELGEGEYPIDIIEDANLYADPERAALLRGQRQEVLMATLSLTEEQRTALILKEIEGLGYEEIAGIMGSNPNAVGALLSRGRLRFREAFRLGHIDVGQAEEECRAYLPLLSRGLDGKLTANEQKLLDLHLQGCPFCRLAREEMQASTESYRALVPLIPAAGLGAGILKGISGTGSSSASGAATAMKGTASRLFLPLKAAGAKLAGLSLATKITAGVITGLLVVGGTVGGIVASGKDSQREEGDMDNISNTAQSAEEEALEEDIESYSWTKQLTADSAIGDIHALDDKHVWAVSNENVYFFDGSKWSNQYSVEGANSKATFVADHIMFTSITATDPNHVWVTASRGSLYDPLDDPEGFVYFYDGSAWTRTEHWALNVEDIDAADPNHVWAVGSESDLGDTLLFFDGISWVEKDVGFRPGVNICALDESHVWLAGWINIGKQPVFFFDGSAWQVQADNLTANKKYWGEGGIEAADSNNVWTSNGSAVFFFDGKKWALAYESTKLVENVYLSFHDVAVADIEHVWAVGDCGMVLFFNGVNWTDQSSGVDERLDVVTACDPEHVWAGSYEGSIYFRISLKSR
jgi:RNA polymerase sigma factor (sigma-70 family)